ncbi:MAG TPA: OmpH family outer membrane protein [Flavobacterium sp.]|jgi:Skp family chaperone for outer membrane proteins
MKKHFLFLILALAVCFTAQSQGRGVKIGFIDMEYILQNVPDYAEAKNQLEQKAQQWKQEIEAKKNDIGKLKESLKTERVLLTKELIEEREEEITFQETELSNYQQKRFGPTGDLITQKSVLVKPIQDQVFTAAQDIAEANKYDFIFDKSSDLTMLFAAKKYDISDRVIRLLTRAERREQMTNKQLEQEESREMKEDIIDENPALQERQKKLDERKAERDKLMEERKLAAEAKKQAFEEKRKQMLAEREAKKNGTTVPTSTEDKPAGTDEKSATTDEKSGTANPDVPATTTDDARQKAAEARAKILEDRKKALEEKRKKALEDREAAKKAKQEQQTTTD